MAQVSIKYKCGEKVFCSGVPGKITGITIRGKGRMYEFSYLDNNGNPACVNTQECELESFKPKPLGFEPNDKMSQKRGKHPL